MKVEQINLHSDDQFDYRGGLAIHIDGKQSFCVFEGEPEDATLGRDFNDCYSIVKLMKAAYEAGKKGETFEVTNITRTLDEYAEEHDVDV